jgi:hypothetical protein
MQPKPSPLAAQVSVHFFSFEIALLHFQARSLLLFIKRRRKVHHFSLIFIGKNV